MSARENVKAWHARFANKAADKGGSGLSALLADDAFSTPLWCTRRRLESPSSWPI